MHEIPAGSLCHVCYASRQGVLQKRVFARGLETSISRHFSEPLARSKFLESGLGGFGYHRSKELDVARVELGYTFPALALVVFLDSGRPCLCDTKPDRFIHSNERSILQGLREPLFSALVAVIGDG